MKQVLVMGVGDRVGQAFFEACQGEKNNELQFNFIEEEGNIPAGFQNIQVVDLQDAEQLTAHLTPADILVINVSGWDVDYVLDAVMDAIEVHRIKLEKIIFRSVAGVNAEYPIKNIQTVTHDQEEFVKQQQYAGKLVDESEIPYTILRPTNVLDSTDLSYRLVNEGTTMDSAKDVGAKAVAKVILETVKSDQYKNQSIGICG